MAALTNYGETEVLDWLMTDQDGLSAVTNWYIALFTADPTDAGTQTNEADYTGYARVAVARSTSGWTVASDTCDNDNAITFGECTAGSNTVTHIGIMDASSSGNMVIHGALSSSLAISAGITPNIPAGDLDITAA